MHPCEVLQNVGIALMIAGPTLFGRLLRRSVGREAGCWLSLAFLIVGALLWIAGKFWQSALERERYSVYTGATARREGARIVTGRTIERDRIELPGPPCPATIRFFHHTLGEERRNYTEFVASPSGTSGAMRISSPEWSAMLNRYYGGRDVAIGDAEFDRRYLIQSNPPELAAEFLDVPTREVIRSFDRFGIGPVLLQIRPGQLLVRVPSRIQEGPALERFIEQCYRLVARLRVDPTPGVELGVVVVPEDAKCPVCGSKIEPAKRVVCRKCATPHHAECWSYNDGCSTFACGERKSRRA